MKLCGGFIKAAINKGGDAGASLYAISNKANHPHLATFFPLATLSGKPIFANRCQQNCQQNIDFVDSK